MNENEKNEKIVDIDTYRVEKEMREMGEPTWYRNFIDEHINEIHVQLNQAKNLEDYHQMMKEVVTVCLLEKLGIEENSIDTNDPVFEVLRAAAYIAVEEAKQHVAFFHIENRLNGVEVPTE